MPIGTVMYNRVTGDIVAFLTRDTMYAEYNLEPEVVSRWLSPDPLGAKHPENSPYVYVSNSPIIQIDPDGRDGIVIIDKVNKTLTVTAVYYVQTENYKGGANDRGAYSSKEVANMQKGINETLNDKNYAVSEGDYAGFSVKFDLQFKEGGNPSAVSPSTLPKDEIEGVPVSNSFKQGNDTRIKLFKEKENPDGTTSTVGGVTENHKRITMNTPKDTKRNKIHEIFHTLFFDNDDAKKGIGSYSRNDMPNQADINTLINNGQLKKVEKKKMKRKTNITVLFLLFITIEVFSQNLKIEKDTFYFLTIVGSLPNGRPMTNIALLKSLNDLALSNKENQDKFICDFYKKGIVSEDPSIGFNNVVIFNKDSAEQWLADINIGLTKINKGEKKVNIFFRNKQNVTVYISKIVALYWHLPISEKSVVNHSIPVQCYNKDYYLTLKKVVKCLKIKRTEIKNIEKN